MATNYCYPFANGTGANVLTAAEYESNLQRTSGFQQGIARSSLVNYPVAQGAMAGYLMGQFAVDYANTNGTLQCTAMYTAFKNALTEYIRTHASSKWDTARTISIQDADGTNTGTGVSVDGSANATLKLPSTIKATLSGNASSATKATQDGSGNNIVNTYATKTALQAEQTARENAVSAEATARAYALAAERAYVNSTFLPIIGGTIHRNGLVLQNTVDNNFIQINGASDWMNGGYVTLIGKDYAIELLRGAVQVSAQTSEANRAVFNFLPDGRILNSKLGSAEFVNASSVDTFHSYIKYSSGFIVQFGRYEIQSTTTFSFEQPFPNACLCAMATPDAFSNFNVESITVSATSTTMSLYPATFMSTQRGFEEDAQNGWWLAIGY